MKCNGKIGNSPKEEFEVGIDTGEGESVHVEQLVEVEEKLVCEFKVGDKVKLIKPASCTLGFNTNDVCTIKCIDRTGNYPITIEKFDDNESVVGYVNKDQIIKIKEEN